MRVMLSKSAPKMLHPPRYALFLALTVTLLTTGCEQRADSLIVEQQTLVPGPRGPPNAILQTSSGELVVAGGRFSGWAFGTSADGRLLWQYEEARDDNIKDQYQSEFHGAVSLSGGNVLLCGETQSKLGGGLIVIVSRDGRLVERRSLFPKDDPKYTSSGFNECVPWNGSVLLLGRATDGAHGFSWFMRLDMEARKASESLNSEIPSNQAVVTADSGLVLADSYAGGDTRVVRVNQKFEVVARRMIRSSGYALLRSIVPSNTTRLCFLEFVVWNSDGKYIAVGGNYPTRNGPPALEIVDANTGKAVTGAPATSNMVALDYSPDGKYLLVGWGNVGVEIWDPTHRQLLQKISGQPSAARFSPDGRHLGVAEGRTISVWDIK